MRAVYVFLQLDTFTTTRCRRRQLTVSLHSANAAGNHPPPWFSEKIYRSGITAPNPVPWNNSGNVSLASFEGVMLNIGGQRGRFSS
ncbi:hypothetical protein CgunFtcFv8_018371 [Champsocephalus gunnari]|uniref:Uncharacterized protein n=1 Tax=Champsocephalus gunnari TaxID=52237 RepID=A0AAN8BSJ4_CHAGU|nr:hypothetical protein CgunFtcFv8_018371 [Champsocephalus gunnari]